MHLTCYSLQNQLGLVSGSMSGGYVNGSIVCRYQRLIKVNSSSNSTDTVYGLDAASYYILMAEGAVAGGIQTVYGKLL